METSKLDRSDFASVQRKVTCVYDEHYHCHEDTGVRASYSQLVMNKMVENKSKFVVQTVHQLEMK
jgi:hypothetical protein